ncbi:unnamed protein product [Rhizophagus irregularis]|nr:unnamed protein product [Rhizophagus irregularis]
MVNFEKNFQNFSLIFFLKKRNVLLILTYLLFIKFGLNHTEFHMDFSQSNPQRNFKGFTLELAIPEDGFPLDFYWMDITDDGETFAIIRSIFSHERNN